MGDFRWHLYLPLLNILISLRTNLLGTPLTTTSLRLVSPVTWLCRESKVPTPTTQPLSASFTTLLLPFASFVVYLEQSVTMSFSIKVALECMEILNLDYLHPRSYLAAAV
jgi:hypothetical protein